MGRSFDGGCCCLKGGLVSMDKSKCWLDPTQASEVMAWDTFLCRREGGFYFALFFKWN